MGRSSYDNVKQFIDTDAPGFLKQNLIGIYSITLNSCLHEKMQYIGSSVNLFKRCYDHKWFLNKNRHHSAYLQNCWNIYGEKSFSFEILELCEKINLRNLEQQYLDNIKPKLNMHPMAIGGFVTGKKHSAETKEKLRRASTGHKHTDQQREKIRLSLLGNKRGLGNIKTSEQKEYLKSMPRDWHGRYIKKELIPC